MKLAILLLFAASAAAQSVPPMAQDAKPRFDVVTVKPTPPAERSQGFQTRGTHIRLVRETVASMVMFAYGVHSKEIVDASAWVSSEAFDVDGVPDAPGEANFAQMQALVKDLLAQRFGFHFHPGTRDLSYYALRLAPGGTRITTSTEPTERGADQTGNGSAQGQLMKFTNNSMAEFAIGMNYFVDRPVVDETGLPLRYDFTLRWQPNETTAADSDTFPSLFTAIREELGLELKPAHGAVPVMVVDAVEKPSAN